MPFGTEEEQLRKLFVGGISFDTTDDNMNEYFVKYGKITDCVVIKESTGKSKGFGFVTYETEEEADDCMKSRPHQINGRNVDVKRAVSREASMKPGAHVQVKKIFIGGIKPDCTDDVLKEYFGEYGTIESCEIPCDRESSKPRGFAFVTFDDFDPVDKLVAKRHHDFGGMHCEVKKALSRQEMDKAKSQGGGGRGGGRGRGRGGGFGAGSGDYGAMMGYGGAYGYGGGYEDYDMGYNGGPSNYGPMKNQYSNRGSGPYGGSYGAGNGYGSSYGAAGRYGGSGYGTYGGGYN